MLKVYFDRKPASFASAIAGLSLLTSSLALITDAVWLQVKEDHLLEIFEAFHRLSNSVKEYNWIEGIIEFLAGALLGQPVRRLLGRFITVRW